MRFAYLDCASGISGDMLLGALIDLGISRDAITSRLGSLGLPGVQLEFEEVKRKGFRGTKVHVRHEPEHQHRHLRDILALIEQSSLEPAERTLAESVFRKLAEAEARVHGTTIDRVHFHEVGAVDSIVDIVGACVGWCALGVTHAVASPIPVGGGFVDIAHGRCPVPAPATAELLRGVPLAPSPCDAELTTPTGAALLACLVKAYGQLPPLTMTHIGYGAGTCDFSTHPNLLRLIVGAPCQEGPLETDEVLCMETNIDDTTGESIAYCMDLLRDAGALDVFASPIVMKKGRPAIKVSLLCSTTDSAALEAILFRETNTIGIRSWAARRSKLPRQSVTVRTPFGEVQGKLVQLPQGTQRFAAEYESCRQRAGEHGVSLREVRQAAEAAFRPSDEAAS